ncbi:MAG: hypothetical protein ABH851_01925 [Methanobacteriota archaeon]
MEPLIHLILPLLSILVFFPELDKRKVYSLLPFAVIHDIDFFFGHAIFHNIFFLAFFGFIVYPISKKNRETTFIAVYYWASHLVLDLQFVALLYPLYDGFISLHANLYLNPGLSQKIPSILLGGGKQAVNLSSLFNYNGMATHLPKETTYKIDKSPLLTSFGLITVIYLAFSIIVRKSIKKKRLKP